MKSLPLLCALLALGSLVGCAPKPAADNAANNAAVSAAPAGGGGDIRPYTPASAAIGGPVMGGESVDGAGMGGVGQAAKDRARAVAGAASTSSVDSAGDPRGN